MNGKGDKDRTSDKARYRSNHDKIAWSGKGISRTLSDEGSLATRDTMGKGDGSQGAGSDPQKKRRVLREGEG